MRNVNAHLMELHGDCGSLRSAGGGGRGEAYYFFFLP